MSIEVNRIADQQYQDRETLLTSCRDGLSELQNFKYSEFIFIGWHEGKRYTFEEGRTFEQAKGQEKQPVDPDTIPLENFPDYVPNSPLLPVLASIISDAQIRAKSEANQTTN